MIEETISRNQEQYLAMNIIYQALTYIDMNEDPDVVKLIVDATGLPFEENSLFLRKVVVSAILHKDFIIKEFSKNLKKWKFNRLNRLEQAILLLSYSHFYYANFDNVEKAIVISIAVKLAKKYLGQDSDYKFVNAILENTLK